MAISQSAAIAKIHDRLAEISGMKRVYAPSETDEDSFPAALNEFPCALVFPGATIEYILSQGQHRHTYEVTVQVFQGGADLGSKAAAVLPFRDRIIETLVGEVGLGGTVNSCLFDRSSELSTLVYNEVPYMGYEITLRVSEQAAASVAVGT